LDLRGISKEREFKRESSKVKVQSAKCKVQDPDADGGGIEWD
jgi:hypothetical protein